MHAAEQARPWPRRLSDLTPGPGSVAGRDDDVSGEELSSLASVLGIESLLSAVPACRRAGAGWEADLQVGDGQSRAVFPRGRRVPAGKVMAAVLDPPYPGSYGSALPAASPEGELARPEQLHR
jgi:hypothetical protein